MRVAREFKERHKKVFDVVLYGSTTMGKEEPNDYDFLVITRGASEGERFDLAFEFREELFDLGFQHEKLDVKALNLEDLFNPNYLATPGVITSGFSLTKGKFIHELMNGEGYSLFIMRVGLRGSERKRFSYALRGRNGDSGVITELGGLLLSSNVALIPVEKTYKFKEFLDYWRIDYENLPPLRTQDINQKPY
ncbi:nucleotidyltransferase domain-containing protein [Pyrococcus sp. NA2]|uniref:nucleotidyltransferase domain-containing protein n=1 Tax=Pyrococcus sp. (strain NA2) TaxID=342949 RepID=UPI001ED96DD4|nr:nucleotidyltransferase domain-containing protein [Pyrococcus sp. NA2]